MGLRASLQRMPNASAGISFEPATSFTAAAAMSNDERVRNHEDGWLCGTGCPRVRFGKMGPDPRYASYYLGHASVREWVVRHAHGATMPNLNTSILSACPFLEPPLLEQ